MCSVFRLKVLYSLSVVLHFFGQYSIIYPQILDNEYNILLSRRRDYVLILTTLADFSPFL